MARISTAAKEAAKSKGRQLKYHLNYESTNNRARQAYERDMDRHFDGRRNSIASKTGAIDSGYLKQGVKPGSPVREHADYKLTGKNKGNDFLGSMRRASAREDQYNAYESARNKGMTPTQAKRASAGIEKAKIQAATRPTPRQQAAKDRGGRKSFVDRQKTVGTVKNKVKQAKKAVAKKKKSK